MNITTDPVRDMKVINDIFCYLKGDSYRNYMMAKVELNTALRISDVLKLKVNDFIHENGNLKESITLKEKKTGKERRIAINTALKSALREYIRLEHLKHNDYLFQSRKGKNKPISCTQAHRIFNKTGQVLHLENFGTHSLRKSWGYFAYKQTKNIALIMQAYNHTSEKVTFRYIGIVQKDKDNLYKQIKF